MARFADYDAQRLFMALSRITLRCIAVKNISCGRPDTYLQDQMSWDRWRFTRLGGRYDRVTACPGIDKLHDSRSDLDKNKLQYTYVLRCFICSTMASPPISVILPRLHFDASPTKAVMLEPMKGKQWEAG